MVLFLPPAGRLLMSKFTWSTLSCFRTSHQLFTNESKNQLHPRSISTAELVECNQAEPLPPINCHAIAPNTHHNTALKFKLRSLLIDADDKVKRGIRFEYKRACCLNTEGEIQLRHVGKNPKPCHDTSKVCSDNGCGKSHDPDADSLPQVQTAGWQPFSFLSTGMLAGKNKLPLSPSVFWWNHLAAGLFSTQERVFGRQEGAGRQLTEHVLGLVLKKKWKERIKEGSK